MKPLCTEDVDGDRYDSGQAPLMNAFFYFIALKFKIKKDFLLDRVKPKLWVKRQIDESRAWIDNENR